jgi:WD40 repeat protein
MLRKLILLCLVLLSILAPVQGQSQILTNFDLLPITAGSAPMLRTLLVEKFPDAEGVLWSPGGTLLAIVTPPGVWLYSYYEEPYFLESVDGTLTGAAFSPGGKTLMTALRAVSEAGTVENKIQVWDMASRESLVVLQVHAPDEYGVAYHTDGRSLVSAVCGEQKAGECRTSNRIFTLPDQSLRARLLAVSPNGEHILSTGDRTLRLWNANNRSPLYTVNGHHDEIRAAAFSPDGTHFASGSMDGMVLIRDAATGEQLERLEGGPVNSLAFSPDGSLLAAGMLDGRVLLWNTRTWELIRELTSSAWVSGIAFSQDGTRLAVGGEILTLWGVRT